MARNDKLLNRPDSGDLKSFNSLVTKALRARRKIETGFIELAESIFDINRKKLYKVKYKTFGEFCEIELGFSRQTIYIYISILRLIAAYPNFFSREKAIEFGHKKMRFITEGVSAIDSKVIQPARREKIKQSIFKKLSPEMAATEIEGYIEDILADL